MQNCWQLTVTVMCGLALMNVAASAAPPSAADAAARDLTSPLGEAHVYKTVADRQLKLWVMRPAADQAPGPRPAIVFFHGGGWRNGTATQFNLQGDYLTRRGMVVVQVQYRLLTAGEVVPANACLDARSAMRYVRAHAGELGIDPERIAAGGGLAGGHLAAYVGMVDGVDEATDDTAVSCRPAAMVLFNPALLHGEEPRRTSEDAGTQFQAISPFMHVSAGDAPGLILVGSEDKILLPAKVAEFQAKCEAAGVRMDAVIYPGEEHSFFGLAKSADRFFDTVTEMDRFLGSLGWLEGPPTLTRDDVAAYSAELKQGARAKPAKKSAPAKPDPPPQ